MRPIFRSAAAGAVMLVLLLALAGPWMVSGSTTAPVGGPYEPPGRDLLLGTDVLGRDTADRLLAGGRGLVIQAVGATLLGSLVGLTLGIWTAVTHRRLLAAAVLRVVDAVAAFPGLLLLLLLAAGAPGSDGVVALAVALLSIPFSVRVLRERTTSLTSSPPFLEAAARGDTIWTRIRFDVLPGLLPTALTEAGIRFVAATQIVATAAFLGLGSGAPTASWGRMVRENSTGVAENPLAVLAPGALLVVLGVGVTIALDKVAGRKVGGTERMGRAA